MLTSRFNYQFVQGATLLKHSKGFICFCLKLTHHYLSILIFTLFSAYFQGNLLCAQGVFAYNPRHYYCLYYHNHLKINRLQTKFRTLNCITLQRYNFFLKYANYYSCISNLKVIYSVTTAVLTVSAERVVRRNAERELNTNIKGASC